MDIDENKAPAQSQHQGQQFYFCSQQCKQQFDKNPQQYTKKSA